MGPLKLLVVAEPYERDGLRAAAAAAGAVTVGVDAHAELAPAVASARPDAVVLAGGPTLRDPAATARRLRALAGARTPIVFVGEAPEVVAVERLVDAAFRRPADAGELISRVVALTVAAPEPAAVAPVAPAGGLLRVAATIDDALDAEMLSAIRTVADPVVATPAPPPPAADVDPLVAIAPPPDALDDLWQLLGDDELASWLPAADAGPRLAGELADADAPLLLARLFNDGSTGRLVIEREGIERSIYFEAGRPVYAASNGVNDRLIAMLARQGRLTPAQHQAALEAAKQSGRKMGALLVDLGVLETGELLPAVRQHYEELVFSLFEWRDGQWRLEPGVMASPTQIRLLRHPAVLVREGLRRCYGRELIWERLGSPANVFTVELEGRAPDILGELVATGAERRLPMLFDGVRPVGEVVRLSGLPEDEALGLVFALSAFALLKPSAAGAPPVVRDREVERERIAARYALALEADYFEVLGVARGASSEEIRRAYELVGRDLAPARLGTELARSMARELDTIREVIEEALQVLGDEGRRGRYQARLPRHERSGART